VPAPPPSLHQLLQFFEKNWIPSGYQTEDEEAYFKSLGREILTNFWERNFYDYQVPLAVERMFSIDIGGVNLRGFIDRIDNISTDGIAIVDYKTNKDTFSQEYMKNDLQLTLYQLAAEKIWQLPVLKLTLYHMRSNTPYSCAPRSAKGIEQAQMLVLDTAENITRSVFNATLNEYCPCDFSHYCPYYNNFNDNPFIGCDELTHK